MPKNIAPDSYGFDGWLVFNGVFFTEVESDDFEPDDFLRRFKTYSPGSPENPSKGFRKTDLSNYLAQTGDLTGGMSNLAESLYTFEYVQEDWIEVTVFDEDGNKITRYSDGRKQLEIFWSYDDVLLIRGPKSILREKKNDLLRSFGEDLIIREVNFDFDFFLWLLYNYHQENDLSNRDDGFRSKLRLRSITDCRTIGKSNLDREVNIGNEPEIVRSVPFISAILEGNKINGLEGDFLLDTHYIVAELESEGRVHIKASRQDMAELNSLRQMGVATQFMLELARLYKEWTTLPGDKKYPPDEFFETLLENCEEEGYLPMREPEELLQEYRKKRATP